MSVSAWDSGRILMNKLSSTAYQLISTTGLSPKHKHLLLLFLLSCPFSCTCLLFLLLLLLLRTESKIRGKAGPGLRSGKREG